MPEAMPFAATVVDHSTTGGFQFEFRCLRCGTGYTSHVHALSALAANAGGTALKKVGGFLGKRAGKEFEKVGGFLGSQAGKEVEKVGDYVGDRAADAVKDETKDRAFQAAVHEVAPQFIRCPGCRRWMCRPRCFNAAAGLCPDCALQVPGGPARSPAILPGSVPPPGHAVPPSQPLFAGYAAPPGHTPYPGFAVPALPPPPGAAALPAHPVHPDPEDSPPSQSPAPRRAYASPLQVHTRASPHHPGRISLVVVDADDQVIAAVHLGPEDAEDLADGLLAAAQTARRRLVDRH
jgi:hypothetical protein